MMNSNNPYAKSKYPKSYPYDKKNFLENPSQWNHDLWVNGRFILHYNRIVGIYLNSLSIKQIVSSNIW